jgi:hypothetical protein
MAWWDGGGFRDLFMSMVRLITRNLPWEQVYAAAEKQQQMQPYAPMMDILQTARRATNVASFAQDLPPGALLREALVGMTPPSTDVRVRGRAMFQMPGGQVEFRDLDVPATWDTNVDDLRLQLQAEAEQLATYHHFGTPTVRIIAPLWFPPLE